MPSLIIVYTTTPPLGLSYPSPQHFFVSGNTINNFSRDQLQIYLQGGIRRHCSFITNYGSTYLPETIYKNPKVDLNNLFIEKKLCCIEELYLLCGFIVNNIFSSFFIVVIAFAKARQKYLTLRLLASIKTKTVKEINHVKIKRIVKPQSCQYL